MVDGSAYELEKVQNKRLLPWQKPLGWGSFVFEQVFPYQNLHQLVPVDLADAAAGIVVVGDVGGVFGQKIANDLVDGIITFLGQGIKHTPEDPAHVLLVIAGYCEFLSILIRHGLYLLEKR